MLLNVSPFGQIFPLNLGRRVLRLAPVCKLVPMALALMVILRLIMLKKLSLEVLTLGPAVVKKLVRWLVHSLKLATRTNTLNQLIMKLFGCESTEKRR